MPLYLQYIEIFISISLISMVSVWIRISDEIFRWTVDVGCTSHPGEYNGDQWPHSLVRTGASSPLLSSDHQQTRACRPCTRLFAALHGCWDFSRQTDTLTTGDFDNQMCLVRLIIMAVLVKFLPGKVVHVALKQTRHWTLYWIRVLRRCKNNPTSSCSAPTGLYDLKDFLFTEQPLLAFIHIHLPLLRSRNWQNYLENRRIIWKIGVYCCKRCV